MLTVKPIQPHIESAINAIEPLYCSFVEVAQSDYAWPAKPLGFESFKLLLQNQVFMGYVLEDAELEKVLGFLIFEPQANGTLEVRILHLDPSVNEKLATDSLFKKFTSDLEKNDGWKVVSFPMMGKKLHDLVQYIPWQGLKPVGQAVVGFDLTDPITAMVYQHWELPTLPEGYKLQPWQSGFDEKVAPILFETFEHSVDALWDPRLWQMETIPDVVKFVTDDEYGKFIGEGSFLLLDEEDQAVGFCFLSQIYPGEVNIPLVGVKKDIRQKHLGRLLVSQTVKYVIEQVSQAKLLATKITATVATENYAAIRMYRHLGFKENYWYPHLYINQKLLHSRKANISC